MRYPPGANATLDEKVARAEALWCTSVSEHNLSFAVSDCFCELVPLMFTDSSIASKFACRRTKTAAVVMEALAPNLKSSTLKRCIQKLCHGDKRGHRTAQIAALNFAI